MIRFETRCLLMQTVTGYILTTRLQSISRFGFVYILLLCIHIAFKNVIVVHMGHYEHRTRSLL